MNKEQISSRGSNVESRELENGWGPVIKFRSEQEEREDVATALQGMRAVRLQAVECAAQSPAALAKLIECMQHKTGQGYKLRKLLHSLWSGSPTADLSDILCLDWELRIAFVAVLMGWGCSSTPTQPEFFYRALEEALSDAGLMDWFREEGGAE